MNTPVRTNISVIVAPISVMVAPLPRRSLAAGAYQVLVQAIVTWTLAPRPDPRRASWRRSRMPVREATGHASA